MHPGSPLHLHYPWLGRYATTYSRGIPTIQARGHGLNIENGHGWIWGSDTLSWKSGFSVSEDVREVPLKPDHDFSIILLNVLINLWILINNATK